ncbi:macro domain-containing protein [Chroococcidiopsis sp.]|uniref:macro domain-containing protein n=1 Tax=Chroococcidiopsis sp. TaxID=3088168 RepID=UPI003F2A0812
MIEFKQGDLLEEDEVDAIVNAVNCVGVMGKGIALQFKEKYPNNFREYRSACLRGEVVPGRMFVTENCLYPQKVSNPRYLINFPTKQHWKDDSTMKYIVDGMRDLRKVIKDRKIRSIAIPALGCGNGGLQWVGVASIMVQYLIGLQDVYVIIYEPQC